MNNYYKMEFVSPESLYAEIKEELRSYFDSGMVDDMMFPAWTKRCLERIRMAGMPIRNTVLHLKDYETYLPDDFQKVRSLWGCVNSYMDALAPTGAYYYQTDCRITNVNDSCSPCFETDPAEDLVNAICDPCGGQQFIVTNKTINSIIMKFTTTLLLKPGNVSTRKNCSGDCPNLGSTYVDSFEIRGNKIVTNFPDGTLYLVYYADNEIDGEVLIPDNYFVRQYIRQFITYKIFEMVANQVTDETFNQSIQKMTYYKRESDLAYSACDAELKKKTTEQQLQKIRQTMAKFNNYQIRNGR
jgi:hypothetical protein